MSRDEWGELLNMSGPVMIEQLSVAFIANFISILMKGTGTAAVAAVNYTNTLTMLFQQSYLAIGVGVTVVVAQYRGRRDPINAGKAARESIMLSVYVATAVAVVVYLFRELILNLILSDSEPLVYDYARTYLSIYVFALPFVGMYMVSAGAIRGSGFPRRSLVAALVYNGSYAVLASFSVYVLDAGLMGVSLSLLVAGILASITGLALLKKGNENLSIDKLFVLKLNMANIRPMLRVGLPIMLERVLFQTGKLVTQRFIVNYGTDIIMVNGLANNVNMILCVPGITCVNATPPIVGRYIGMGDTKNAKRKAFQFLLLCMISMGAVAVIMMMVLGPYAAYYSDAPSVQQAIWSVVTFQCITMPLAWALAFVGPSILRSSGDSMFTAVISIAAMFTMRIGIGYLCTQVLRLGVTGVWIGMFADWLFRGLFFAPRLLSGKWLKHDLFR